MINLTLVIDESADHLGIGYESYKVLKAHDIHPIKLLEKSLTDNSKVYDVVIYDDFESDNYIVLNPTNKAHAKRMYKILVE